MRKFTAAEVQAIIEAERRGEFQLPEGDYTDATLTAALERIDTAAAYKITARRAIAEMEQPAPAKHGYGCACADCGREREDRKASDRQDCETSEMTEEAKAANRAMIAEMEQPAPELPAPFLVMDDSDDSAHGTFETWGEARGCIAYDHLSKWTIYRAGQIVESSATA
jgi:hypothetical protein